MLQELEFQVLDLYQGIDEAVTAYKSQTGLACPEGCGHCCNSEKVEATVIECIPLAFELFRTLQAELLIKRLERGSGERRCVLYRQDFTAAGLWGCSQYKHRSVVCRLFGFAGNRDRSGTPQLAKCRKMKEHETAVPVQHSEEAAAAAMPLFSDAGMRITALHPGLGSHRKPINEALFEALQKVGMFLDMSAFGQQASKAKVDSPPDDEPLFPLPPLKKRAA
jgi:Fe-S-cluster containining protein